VVATGYLIITGVTGSHVSGSLLARGGHVFVPDDLFNGRLDNLDLIGNNSSFRPIQGLKFRDLADWRPKRTLEDILDDVIAESRAEQLSTKLLGQPMRSGDVAPAADDAASSDDHDDHHDDKA